MAETQNYKNHIRWHAPQHFVLTPILLINFIYAIVRLIQEPNIVRAEFLLLSIGLLIMGVLARINALRVQDRLIRLEEKLRYEKVLPAALLAQTENLSRRQINALRFASDAELPTLVQRTLNGEFQKTDEIKRAVTNWRGDYLRV
ncbi:MAG TPA: DUF6526 family protein [Pyrinomonadaceae bacterium]|nr:DUF6526 family protein [Pyrinomonadaceae bacterium]